MTRDSLQDDSAIMHHYGCERLWRTVSRCLKCPRTGSYSTPRSLTNENLVAGRNPPCVGCFSGRGAAGIVRLTQPWLMISHEPIESFVPPPPIRCGNHEPLRMAVFSLHPSFASQRVSSRHAVL